MRNPDGTITARIDGDDEEVLGPWRSITVSEQWALPKKEQKILQDALLEDPQPLQAAFIRNEGGHATLYLTPYCPGLALAIGATECERPSKDEVMFHMGDDNAKRLLE